MRDDGILIVKAKQTEINSLFENANRQHELLKFTYECNNHSTKFRDLEIYKGKCSLVFLVSLKLISERMFFLLFGFNIVLLSVFL
jgi:hypothetical protein